MTDQESACYSGPARRPNYELLKTRGLRFASTFCNTPQCSPARSSLLTGLEPHHSGVITNVDGGSLGRPLSPEHLTLGSLFEANGYRTGYFGKWHLGKDSAGLKQFGFSDRFDGTDEEVARAAANWIKGQSAPWLAWVSVLNPHNIYQFTDIRNSVSTEPNVPPPATNRTDLAQTPSPQLQYLEKDQGRPTLQYTAEDWIRYRSFYGSLLEKADSCLGTVLGSVKDLSNTIIAYTSDHGDELGEHGLPFKGPFMYEPLIRIPLIVCAPSLPFAEVRKDFALSIDVAPTVAGLAGLKFSSAIDGKDLSKGPSGRDAVFLEYYGKQHWVEPIRTIREARWKLNLYPRGETELYDLQNDPNERTNLANSPDFADVRRRLKTRLTEWQPEVSGPRS